MTKPKTKVLFSLSLLVFLGSAPLYAQNSLPQQPASQGATTISNETLLSLALNQYPALLAAQAELKAAQAEQQAMQALLWPALSFNSQSTAGTADRMSMPVPGIEPANMSMRPAGLSANLNLTAMMPLFTGGKLQAQLEAAQRKVQQLQADYRMRRLEIYTRLQTLLLTRYVQSQQIDLLQHEWQWRRQERERVQQTVTIGKQTQAVLLRARSSEALVQQELNLRQLELKQSELELRNLATLAADTPLPAPDEPVSLPQSLPPEANAWEHAQKNAPQLARLQAQLAEAQTRVQIAQASYWPFVYLVGVYEQRLPEMPQMSYTSGGAIDLLISMPVFDGFKRDAELQRFEHEVQQIKYQQAEAQNRLQTDLAKLYLELETAQANLKLNQSLIEQSTEDERIARLRYDSGKMLWSEYLDVEHSLRQAKLQHLKLDLSYQLACLRLSQLIGQEDLPESVITR